MGFRRQPTAGLRVDLTPMIDVVFLLLIFFMISTTFVEKPGLQIDLPAAAAQQLPNEGKELQLYLAADGTIYLQQQQVSLSEFYTQLNAYGPAARQMTFLLMADKAVRHGRVIQLMDAAKSAGFSKLAIATEKKERSVNPQKESTNE